VLTAQSVSSSITIYNDGRVLVRRTLPMDIPKGNSSQWAALGLLDPASLFSLDSTVVIAGATYDPASEIRRVMRGAPVVFPELKELLAEYARWSQRTNGAINVNVRPRVGVHHGENETYRQYSHAAEKEPASAKRRQLR